MYKERRYCPFALGLEGGAGIEPAPAVVHRLRCHSACRPCLPPGIRAACLLPAAQNLHPLPHASVAEVAELLAVHADD